MDKARYQGPTLEKHPSLTDSYFLRTKSVVERMGDADVTYAVFMRRPVLSAPRLAMEWVASILNERSSSFNLELRHPEGSWVGAGDPILYLSGQAIATG